MTCQEVQERISQFTDDELDPALVGPMFTHLGACPECQNFLRSVLRLRTALSHEPHAAAPDVLEQRVMNRLRRSSSEARLPADVWSIRIAIPLPAAMAMAVLLVVISIVCSPLIFERRTSFQVSEETLQQLPAPLRTQMRLTQVVLGQ
ncbi:MAG: zf-HC2 domain-containing protein [Bacteroidota bacterium]|mgnify:FL=1